MRDLDAQALLVAAGLLGSGGQPISPDSAIPAFDTFEVPSRTEALGEVLAARLTPLRPDCLMVWDGPDQSVLAHVVAMHLGIRWVRAYDDGGYLRYSGRLTPSSRTVLLDDAFRSPQRVRGLYALANLQQADVVAAAALVGSQALAGAARELGLVVVTAVDG